MIKTEEAFQALNRGQLTELYNQLNPGKPVKSFSTLTIARDRVRPLWQAALAEQTAAPARPNGPKELSLSAKICALIKQGFTNAAIIEQLGLVGHKKTYPAWNRAMLKRTGK